MSSVESPAKVYFSPRMLALLGLGFAAGLPSMYELLGSTLQTWLIDQKYDLKTIGAIALISLPFSLNFLAAPFLDRYQPPLFGYLGRRRGWLILIQLALIGSIIGMGLFGPRSPEASLTPFLVFAFMVASFAAVQDVVADAYRTDMARPHEQGPAAALYVNGYRIGMFVAGGAALWLADSVHGLGLSWNTIYIILGAVMSLGLMATLMAPRPENDEQGPVTLGAAVVEPFYNFFVTRGLKIGAAVLLFAILFKLPDAMANQMVQPLLFDAKLGLGFAKTEVAVIRKGIGLFVVMAGALAGGWMTVKLGLWRSLWVFGVLQAVSNLGWVVLAYVGKSTAVLTGVVVVESFCAGLVTAGFVAFLMSQCDRRYSATQYALFTSMMALAGIGSSSVTGVLVKEMGFTSFFVLTVLVAAPSLMLLPVLRSTLPVLATEAPSAAPVRATITGPGTQPGRPVPADRGPTV